MSRHLRNPPRRSDSLWRAKELHLLPGSRCSTSASSITRGFIGQLDFPSPPKSCPAVIPPDWGKPPPKNAGLVTLSGDDSDCTPPIIILESGDDESPINEPNLETLLNDSEDSQSYGIQEDDRGVSSPLTPALRSSDAMSVGSTDTGFSIDYPSHISNNRRLRRETSVGRPSPLSQTFSASSCSQYFSPTFDVVTTPETANTDISLAPPSPTFSVKTCNTENSHMTQSTVSTVTAHYDTYLRRPVLQATPDDTSSLFKRRRLRRAFDTSKLV